MKTSYEIPSPTIILSNELSSPIKSITNSQTIIYSSHLDDHRKLIANSSPQSFYLKTPEDLTLNSEKFLPTNVNSLNLIRKISSEDIQISDNHHSSTQLNLSIKQSNIIIPSSSSLIDKFIHSDTYLSQTLNSVKHSPEDLTKFSNHENILLTSPFEITSHRKNETEIKQEYESQWKTKFPLKILMSLVHRNDVQALKHRKPIDYHLFLGNKFNKNSRLQFNDEKSISSYQHLPIDEQTQKYFPRILNTMSLAKPNKIQSTLRKNKHQIRIESSSNIKINPLPYINDITNENEKPFLTIYQAVLKCTSHQ